MLAALASHLAAAAAGQGRLVLLSGEAGVGKTTVLERFAGGVGDRVEVLRGWCEPLSTPRPLGPWVDIAPGLGVSLPEQPRPEPDAVSRLLRQVLAALDAIGPVVLLLEDIHWADAATLDVICLLARRIGTRAVLLVVSYRDDEVGPAHSLRPVLGYLAGVSTAHRLAVEPLTVSGVGRLAAGRRVDVADLYRVTGGNPFFVTEVLASGGSGIPASVADVVAGRLARVSSAARYTSEALAVIGAPAPMHLLDRLVEEPRAALVELLGAGLVLSTESGVAYRHELAREAVLATVAKPERTRLHARILDLLRNDPERREDQARLAHHAAGAENATAVLQYAPAAAGQAGAVGAFREAAEHLGRALHLGSALPPDRHASLLEQFAQFSGLASRLDDAADAFAAAAELRRQLGDLLREGDDLRWLSFVLWPLGQRAESLDNGRRAVAALETLPPSHELAAAYLNLCRLCALDHRGTAAAEAQARRAIPLGSRFGAPDVVSEARYFVGLTRYTSADDAGAAGWAEMESARAAALEAGLVQPAAFMAMLMGMAAAWRRDHNRNDSAIGFLVRLLSDHDIFSFLDVASSQRSYCALQQGRWTDATDLAAGVLDQPGPAPTARILPLLVLGLVRARRGDPEAWPPLDEGLEVPEPTGSLLVRAARAEAAWLVGDLDRTRLEAKSGLDQVGPHMDPWVTGELARWSRLAGGDPPDVRAAGPFRCELAGDWRTAAEIWEDLGCPYDAAIARLAGNVPALTQAEHMFDELGAMPAREIARARLRSRGSGWALVVRDGRPGPTRTG